MSGPIAPNPPRRPPGLSLETGLALGPPLVKGRNAAEEEGEPPAPDCAGLSDAPWTRRARPGTPAAAALRPDPGRLDPQLPVSGKDQLNEAKLKCEAIQKRENERRQADEKKHKEEVEYLTRHAKQLKDQLSTFLAPAKK